jgi:hypothetical protein
MSKFSQHAVCGFGAAVLLGLSGCAVMDQHHRVADWPELKVVEHHVSNQEMRDRCSPYVGNGMSPMGCTLFFLDQREAHIYVSKDFPSQPTLEHERLHAAGYDHVGSGSMQAILKNWKASNRQQIAVRPLGLDAGTPLGGDVLIQ